MARRILLLGATGVQKKRAIDQLRKYQADYSGSAGFVDIDFEKEFIQGQLQSEYHDYLDAKENRQCEQWRRAWKLCADKINEQYKDKDVVLAMHAVLCRPLYGSRSPIDITCLKQFGPTAIVTLIENVYTQFYRTELRAGGLDYIGRPTLSQLLDARRAEVLVGDIIANHCDCNPPIRNYVVAVNHPVRILSRLLFRDPPHKTVYLSFPISGPRRRAADGDNSGIEEINTFLRKANDHDQKAPASVFFCPLTIDELPLTNKTTSGEFVELRRSDLWKVTDFYGADPLLTDPADLPQELKLPVSDTMDASGLIKSDVATRDYRLVLQSTRLAVFNPWFDGRISGGVGGEIDCALHYGTPVHIFQDRKHDPEDKARETLQGPQGSLGVKLTARLVVFHESVDELFRSLLN